MGQGLYNLLGFGVLNPPYLKDDDANETLFEEAFDLGVRRSYEAEPDFLVVKLAVDDGFLQDWWKLPELPDSVLRCAARKARYAEDSIAFPVPDAARDLWQSAKLLFGRHGLTLPDARLVVINDWD